MAHSRLTFGPALLRLFVMSQFLTPNLVQYANTILQWADSYLTKDNENIKRPHAGGQVVCPFVGPAMANDCMYLVFHPEIGDHVQEDQLEQIIEDYIPIFHKLGPYHR